MTDIYSQQARNKRITILLMAAFFVFAVLVGVSVDIYRQGGIEGLQLPIATASAAGFALINSAVSYYWGASLVLGSVGAEPLKFDDLSHKKLHNVVTEMALASGLPMPKVYVIPDPSPNAFAAGRDPENAYVAVTQGLLDIMERDELQSVVAHEMSHIKGRDILTMTVVAVLLGTVSLLSDWAVRTWRYGGIRPRRGLRGKGIHPLILLALAFFVMLSPLISRLMA
ncbi:MAG: M48 family metalloprotease, partial [Deltaproteobacteria bacterium]